MIGINTELRVIRQGGMFEHAGIPKMRNPKRLQCGQGGIVDVVEFSASVFFDRAVKLVGRFPVAEQTCK
ncbi:hypothetical protein D3C87_1666830 [compost metagenome]